MARQHSCHLEQGAFRSRFNAAKNALLPDCRQYTTKLVLDQYPSSLLMIFEEQTFELSMPSPSQDGAAATLTRWSSRPASDRQ